ncbi:MAG: VWA domain-containing protein [Oligoflexia bacterium]|nr:VWA domain-containing protein [Oligoflexia bacterium]
MSGLHLAHPAAIHLVWLVLLIIGGLIWAEATHGDRLGRFLSAPMQTLLVRRPAQGARVAAIVLAGLCLLFGVAALTRPQIPGKTEVVHTSRRAADIMVVLDVSRSMLAEDAAPSRLARAKAEIGEMADQLAGNRFGLVAFAGKAAVLCPLTGDLDFFHLVLSQADPGSVSRGGTRIGDGLRKALSAFGPGRAAKLVLLVTDGEDHDSFPKDAAKSLAEQGITVVAVGFGSEEGSPITLTDPETGSKTELKDSSGQVVTSRLDGDLLRDIALSTKGAYIPAGVATLDLESVVQRNIVPLTRDTTTDTSRVVPFELYPWLLLASLLSLVTATWLGTWRAS